MSLSNKDIELVNLKIRGKLDSEQATLFKEKLSISKAFRDAYELERRISRVVAFREIRSAINEVDSDLESEGFFEEKSQSKVISLFKSKYVAIAASFLLIATAYFVYQYQKRPLINLHLVNQYLASDEVYIKDLFDSYGFSNIDGSPEYLDKQETLRAIVRSLEASNLEEARLSITSYLENYPNDENALYIKARILLGLELYSEAGKIYSELQSANNSEIQNESAFYHGLCMLKSDAGMKDGLKTMQAVLKDDQSEWKDEAEAVLKSNN